MSTKLTGYVWDGCAASGMKLSSVAIMARLADFSNDEGVCWPSIETIARQIGAGMSTVRTAIARLEAEGWLTRRARRQGTRRHFPRLTEIPQEPEPQPVRESRPVRNFYVGTNDPRVILCLTRQAEELESRGLYRRAATVWMAAFRESHSQQERNNFLARRERCLRKSSKRAVSGEEWYLSGNYVGA
ncbi:TPA: PerC family transcriptional regulator [Escherichia coli]|nr:PerC family transcriptional regulator [Escherichia coli]